MNLQKQIPLLFTDIISVIIPGAILTTAVAFSLNSNIGNLLIFFIGGSKSLTGSTFFLLAEFLLISFISGELILPIGNMFEKNILAKIFGHFYKPIFIDDGDEREYHTPRYSSNIRNFLINESKNVECINNEQYLTALATWLNWLLNNYPDIGLRLKKLKAKYIMLENLAVGFFISMLSHGVISYLGLISFSPIFMFCSSLLLVLSVWAHIKAYTFFRWNLMHKYFAAKKK